MNLAFFNKQLPSDAPNGVSCQVHRLANALIEKGHAVTCFSFSPKPLDARYSCVPLVTSAKGKFAQKFAPSRAFNTIDAGRFDVVHYHGDDYLCAGSSRRVRTFYGSSFHEALHAKNTGRRAYHALFYLFEIVSALKKGITVGISRATAAAIPGIGHVIPCGVPRSLYRPGNEKTTFPSILFVGDLKSRKRGDLMVSAFNGTVLPNIPDCRLTIVGPEPCRGENIRHIRSCSEAELIREYRSAWVYSMPSSYEGFGVPLIEAMSCGTAVVATRNKGSSDIITDGVNGMLVSPASLGGQLMRVLQDEALRTSLVTHGLETAESYDIHAVATQYERLYRSIPGGDVS